MKKTNRNGLIIRMYWHGASVDYVASYYNLSESRVYAILATSRRK